MYKTDKKGKRVPTAKFENMLKFMSVYNPLAPRGQSKAIHYCDVVAGSEAAMSGRVVGTPCCDSVQEGREKAAGQWTCYCFGSGYQRVAQARWTNTSSNARRMILPLAELGEAVDDVRRGMNLDDTLEGMLADLLRKDRSDEGARNRLTLLRTA